MSSRVVYNFYTFMLYRCIENMHIMRAIALSNLKTALNLMMWHEI
jgi:hypothetical protein